MSLLAQVQKQLKRIPRASNDVIEQAEKNINEGYEEVADAISMLSGATLDRLPDIVNTVSDAIAKLEAGANALANYSQTDERAAALMARANRAALTARYVLDAIQSVMAKVQTARAGLPAATAAPQVIARTNVMAAPAFE